MAPKTTILFLATLGISAHANQLAEAAKRVVRGTPPALGIDTKVLKTTLTLSKESGTPLSKEAVVFDYFRAGHPESNIMWIGKNKVMESAEVGVKYDSLVREFRTVEQNGEVYRVTKTSERSFGPKGVTETQTALALEDDGRTIFYTRVGQKPHMSGQAWKLPVEIEGQILDYTIGFDKVRNVDQLQIIVLGRNGDINPYAFNSVDTKTSSGVILHQNFSITPSKAFHVQRYKLTQYEGHVVSPSREIRPGAESLDYQAGAQ